MRNSPSNPAGNFPPMSPASTYSDVVWGWLAERYAPLKHAEKLLARDAHVTPRTARGWLQREHAPYGEALLDLMAQNDGLTKKINAAVEERRCAHQSSSRLVGAGSASMAA